MYVKIPYLIVIYLVLSTVQYTFARFIPNNTLNKIFPQLDDLFLFFLIFWVVIARITNGRKQCFTIPSTPIDNWVFMLVPFFVFNVILNNVPIVNAVMSIKVYGNVWLLYFVILWMPEFNHKITRMFVITVFCIFLFQLVLQIYQVLSTLASGGMSDDTASGTFSVANTLSYAYFFPVFLTATLFFIKKRMLYMILLIISITGMILSWGMFSIMVLPFIFTVYNYKRVLNKNNVIVAMITFVLVIGVFAVLQKTNDNSQGQFQRKYGVLGFFSPQYIIAKFTQDEFNVYSGSARLLWFSVTVDRMKQYAISPWIGMGAGMYASYTAFRYMSEPQMSIYNIFGQIEKGFDAEVDSQIIPIWGEFGYIGLLVTFLFLAVMARTANKMAKVMRKPLERSVAVTASAGSLYLIAGLYVNHVLETQNIMVFYILCTAMCHRIHIEYVSSRKRVDCYYGMAVKDDY